MLDLLGGLYLQVMLLNAAKDVASALTQMIESAKNASGKSGNEASMTVLRESARVSIQFHSICSFALLCLFC